ncbi:U3 small nucleolar RNA-associated protein 10, partial [Termitomyces sp. T112]
MVTDENNAEISLSSSAYLFKACRRPMSSLAAQLAQNASLNAALLVDRSRRKSAESYLFTGREADQHDLESIHALGVNGLLQLALLNPALRKYEDQLFSEYAKATDRTLLPLEVNAELDAGIATFLALLGPYVMEAPTGRVLEWLVRRFRINEFNIEAVLSLFLPYHESPHFTKMLSILHIKQNSTWSFLLPFKSAAQNLPRMSLVTEMLRNTDVSRFVTSLLPSALKENRSHRVLLAFNAACLHDFVSRSKALDEGTVAYLLPALLEPLQSTPPIKDAILGSYVLLAALSQKCRIAPAALSVVLNAMTNGAENILSQQYINAILSVCEPQDELEAFSEATLEAMLHIPNIEKELRNASVWIGVEKILNPLIPGLISRLDEEKVLSVIDCLLTAPKIPEIFIQRTSLLLIRSVIFTNVTSEATTARRLLAAIQQRHPNTFQESMNAIKQDEDVDQETVDQLRISLTIVEKVDNPGDNIDMILASTNADSKVRAVAVTDLLGRLSQSGLSTDDTKSIHSALLARVQDINQNVIDALYTQPSVVLPVLSGGAEIYINYLSTILTAPGSKPKRSSLRTHLTFLATYFSPANTSRVDDIFQRIFFPFLLFSKPRQHSAEVVWDTLSAQKSLGDHEWLAGCTSIVAEERAKDTADTVEKMSTINTAFSSRIARNILKSSHYQAHLQALIAKLKDANPHTRVLGYLIARALLTELSGEHQVEAGHRVIDVIDVSELHGMEDFPQEDSDNGGAFSKVIVTKPSSRSTLQRLQLSIIALLPSIQRPTSIVLNWLAGNSNASSDKRGSRYVELIRKVYKLANMSNSTPVFTISVLRSLFINLKSDALAFLAGIWTSSSNADENLDNLRTVALHHAAAFLQAHLQEDDGVDFQTILPSLLVALQSPDKDQRNVTLTCVSTLCQLAERKFTKVYGFDAIYGNSENQLQYLDRDDVKTYLDAIIQCKDHLAHDPEYIKVFHQEHLGRNKADKKKILEYKHRVLCFIVSHVNALALPAAQIVLLRSIESISDSAKAEILLPTIKSLLASKKSDAILRDLTDLVMPCFDASVAKDLNEEKSALWDAYVSVVRFHFAPNAPPSSQTIIARSLEHGLFSALSTERKISLCTLLLELGTQHADAYAACKQLLLRLVEDVPLITHLLASLQPTSYANVQPATKRAKITYASENTLPRLGLFIEVLGARSLPGSLDLISNLLETLNRVLQWVTDAQTDINYVEQLLMSAIENAANKVKEVPNLAPSVIRLEILVELIRVSDNPQTFHQALLLMAKLARLAPDSVLHHVMPVFTFMGSNVFHRDDTYSFKVVQQTVDSIVPVMVASLKRSHSQPLDLYIGSRDFLRVFTDAANHIPRHRRTNFFAHLVDVLGPEDFLAPVCMLLVEKVANRVIKQDPGEIQTFFSLPTSVL